MDSNRDTTTAATEKRARASGLTAASALRLPLVIRRHQEHVEDTVTYGVRLTDEEFRVLHALLTLRVPGTQSSAISEFGGLRDLHYLLTRVQRGE